MSEGGLTGVDLTIVLVYLAGVLVLGTWFARFVRTSGDFFIAGKSLPFWAVGMSIVVSDIGATDFIAVAGGTYRYGMAQANFDWLGSMPALLIAAFLFVPYYWRSGVFTVPEFLGRRYGSLVRSFLALAWGLILVLTLGIMIHATAVLMRSVLGWDPQVSIWVTAVVVGVYTISGGLAAVVMTDVIQLVIMFVGGGALLFRALWEVGGWSALREGVLAQGPAYADHFKLYLPHDSPTPFPWTGIVLGLGIVLSTAYFTSNQAVVQRALGARSEWDAKAGVLFAGGLKLFIPLLVALPGLAAILIVPGLENPDEAVPSLIALLLPPGLRGLMFAAFLAALMSSVDSALNSASTLWTQDLVGPLRKLFGRALDEREQLRWGRIISVVLLLAAALVAPEIERRFTNIYNALQSVFSLIQGPTLAILLLGVLWRRANRWGAITGLVVGVGFCVVLSSPAGAGVFPSEEPFLFVAWWSFVLTLAVTALVSRLTPPEAPERIRGLVWGDVMADDEVQAALRARLPDAGAPP
jgi:SSS family solute:Na+ symporter